MIKNIILTGASGFLGKEVSQILSKKNTVLRQFVQIVKILTNS